MADEPAATATVSAFTVSRLPDDSADHATWSVVVEAAGHGRWAVRNMGRCLNRAGEWEHEPLPSSRTAEWLATTRWDNAQEALAAAFAAEPHLLWNGLTPADVVAGGLIRLKVLCDECRERDEAELNGSMDRGEGT